MYLRYFLCITIFFSCKEPDSAVNNDHSELQNHTLLNNIQIKTSGVTVSRALLLNEEGTSVSSLNETFENKPVKLRVFVADGWIEKSGKIHLGAYQKIETFKHQTVLEENDLFEKIGPVSIEEAKMITISANINKIYRNKDSFLVSFKIWDKNGTGEIEGSYKIIVHSTK